MFTIIAGAEAAQRDINQRDTQNYFVYYSMSKKVPQRRNKNAGKSTGKSKSAKYFAANPEARKKKNEYNKKYHSTAKRKKYRANANKLRKNLGIPKGSKDDASEKKGGGAVREKRSVNRARNGKGGKSSKK